MQSQIGLVATLMLMGNEKEARVEAEKVSRYGSQFLLGSLFEDISANV